MIQTIPSVAFIVYLFVELYKAVFSRYSKALCLIPVIAAILGGTIAIIFNYFVPSFGLNTSWYNAMCVGCFSGLSATGINQIGKQIIKLNDDENTAA